MSKLKKDVEWKHFTINLKLKEFCYPMCKYFNVCPLAVHGSRKKDNEPCRVKNFDQNQRRQFLNILVFGEEGGLKDEALQVLFKLTQILNLDDDPKEMEKFIDLCVKVAKAFRTDVTPSQEPEKLTINIEGLDATISDKPYLVEGTDLIVTEDPESLMKSDKLDAIIEPIRNKAYL